MEDNIKSLGEILAGAKQQMPEKSRKAPDVVDADYTEYLKKYAPFDRARIEREIKDFDFCPMFTIVVDDEADCAGDGAKKLDNSLKAQLYTKYEMINARGGAADTGRGTLAGDYVLTLRSCDTLLPDALFHFAHAINEDETRDMLYADEDEASDDGKRKKPFFKPAYSEAALIGTNYIGRPLAIKRCVYERVSAECGLHGAPDLREYRLALMSVLYAKNVYRIDRVLLSRSGGKGAVPQKEGKRAIDEYLGRKSLRGIAADGLYAGSFRTVNTGLSRRTGIVIPTRNDYAALRVQLESIEENAAGANCTLVIADGGSRDERTLRYYDALTKTKAAQIAHCQGRTYSELCNEGAKRADCDSLLFLTSGTRPVTPAFLTPLASAALHKKTVVGARVLDPNGNLASTGYTIGIGGWADALWRGSPAYADVGCDDYLRDFFTLTLRGVSAVSGDCMFVDAETFFDVGCFDESFRDAGADIELCLRILRRGGACVYTPFCEVMAKAAPKPLSAASTGDKIRIYDVIRETLVKTDPNFSPNYEQSSVKAVPAKEIIPPIELNEMWKM